MIITLRIFNWLNKRNIKAKIIVSTEFDLFKRFYDVANVISLLKFLFDLLSEGYACCEHE